MPNTNTPNLNVRVVASGFRDSTGQRGRPQKHPQVTINMDECEALVTEHGEKKIRNLAFRDLRSQLGLDSKVVLSEHPKTEGVWILKAEMESKLNYHVIVTPGSTSSEG